MTSADPYDGSSRRNQLHNAARTWRHEQVAALLEQGADVHAKDSRGATPLHHAVLTIAADAGRAEATVRLLMDAGADIEAKASGGMPPLLWAVIAATKVEKEETNEYAMVELLLGAGASINACDDGWWTALHHVATSDHPELVALLIARGAYAAMEDRFDKYPLDWFSYRRRHITDRHRETAREFIKGLGGVSKVDMSGNTLLHRAVKHANLELARLLLSEGAAVNTPDRRGLTALSLAIKGGHRKIIELLLGANADPNLGKPNAHEIAEESSDESLVNLLRQGTDRQEKPTPGLSTISRSSRDEGTGEGINNEWITCRSCGYAGDIDRFPDTSSIYTDIRCPKCGSTDNQWNDDYARRLREGMRK